MEEPVGKESQEFYSLVPFIHEHGAVKFIYKQCGIWRMPSCKANNECTMRSSNECSALSVSRTLLCSA